MTTIGAWADIYWLDESPEDIQTVYISFGEEVLNDQGDPVMDLYGVPDEEIFFYGSLTDKDDYIRGSEGWVLVSWTLCNENYLTSSSEETF